MHKTFLQLYSMDWVHIDPQKELLKSLDKMTFLSHKSNKVYCLTRKILKCNSLVKKICLFLQKDT